MYSNNIKKIRIVADVASVFAESLERRKLYWAEQLHTGIVFMGFSLLSASEFLQTEKWRCAKQ